jgi:hypothetical protein
LSNAGKVTLCVEPSSPVGDYTFAYSDLNNQVGLPGNNFEDGGFWTDLGGSWMTTTPPAPENLNDGSTTAFSPNKTGVTIHNNGNLASPDCVDALERTQGSQEFRDNLLAGKTAFDTWSGMTITATTNTVGAVYSETDCILDLGVIPPERVFNPIPAAWNSGTAYAIGDYVSTGAVGSRLVWRALTPSTNVSPSEGANWSNKLLGDCGANNNPTRALANFEHGVTVLFQFASAPVLGDCVLGYPYTSNVARTSTTFNESEVLTGFLLDNGKLHMWYSDEHALTLGVDSVYVNNKNTPDQYFGVSNFPATYALEKMAGNGNPGPLTSGVNKAPAKLNVGRTSTAANPAGIASPFDGAGRPLFPALFLTDIFGKPDNVAHNDPAHRSGDWQYGGTPIAPNAVYGTWKGATIVVNNTKNPSVTSITPGADPAKNHKVVGTGGINPPAATQDFGYTADVVWDISTLGLTPGHPYRAQFMVHDGDQNKTGGDVGEACVIIQ